MSAADLIIWLPAAAAAITVFLGVVTTRGRAAILLLFKGSDITQIAQVSADQIATVQAAYEVVKAELERQREEFQAKIAQLTAQNEALTTKLAALQDAVSGKQEIEALTRTVVNNHNTLIERLNDIAKAVRP